MSDLCAGPNGHPVPRAHLDPIIGPDAALALVCSATSDPPVAETIVVLLAPDRTGSCVVIVDGTDPPEREVDVVEALSGIAARSDAGVAAMLVATVRPGGGVMDDDADRWLEMSSIAEQHGLVLVEWFVCGTETECPRDLLGDAPRWQR